MSDIDSERALSTALRELVQGSPRNAPPEVGSAVTAAFRRHHRRLRLVRASALCAIIVTLGGGLLWLRTGSIGGGVAQGTPSIAVPDTRQEPAAVANVNSKPILSAAGTILNRRRSARTGRAKTPPRATFVMLPAFALRMPDEDLRIIRVQMPLSSLRLLGAQVNEDLFTRVVTADLLVGADGTAYAFRLIT